MRTVNGLYTLFYMHIELFHWGSGYTSIRLLTEFAQFAKEKGERDPPQKPARGGLVPFDAVTLLTPSPF